MSIGRMSPVYQYKRMINKKKILVFPCGSEIALNIHSSVKYSTYFELIGANSVDDHGKYVYNDYISGLPMIDDPDIIPALHKIVEERKIDAIFPSMDKVITVTKKFEKEIGCKVIASSSETADICLSKEKTYKILAEVIKIPKIYSPHNIPDSEFPVFAKPIVGYCARGTMKLNNQREVENFITGKKDIIISEYLPGEEFTVDCFTDRYGHLLYAKSRKRNRISNGICVNTYFVEDQSEFEKIAEKINSVLNFRGAWFFQLKRDNKGELTLLEIASRLGGSSLLSRSLGVNLALLSLFDAFDYDVSVFPNTYSIQLDRALESKYKSDIKFDTVYCDYDDCLILEKSIINVELVKFLYSCINNGKKIILLTKHSETDLIKELERYRLDHLFDEIIHISQTDEKIKYITEKSAIFIDDSISERRKVQQEIEIPVFGPEMIDVPRFK